MAYYIMVEDEKIIACGFYPCTSPDIINCEVSKDVYNRCCKDMDYYIYKDGEIIKNPNYEQQKEQEHRAYLSKLAMTKYDFYKYVCLPNEITYTQLLQMVNSSEDVAAAWNLCGHVFRGDETLCDKITTFLPAMTSDVLDAIFEQYGKVIND